MADVMNPSAWEKEYAKGTPHWAKDKEPSEFAKEFAVELEKKEAKTVLEIGSGNGRDSIFFAKKGFKVSAVDVSPSAVELAKSNMEKTKVDVNIQEANAESLPFSNSEFDGVFSLSVLHSTNLRSTLPEVYRVLKSKGYAFIYIYGSTQHKDGGIDEKISLDNYIKLLKTTGFIVWDLYTEEEEKFDSLGEKHKIFVARLGKG